MFSPKQMKAQMWQALKAARLERYCGHPLASSSTCSEKIVSAHTISKSGGLARIAQAGHIYQLKPDPWADDDESAMPCKKVGVNNATTFPGFCAYHDSTTFAPLETQPFIASEEQCFLLGYRALCREYYLKRVQVRAFTSFVEIHAAALPKEDPDRYRLEVQLQGSEAGLRVYGDHKKLYDAALLSGDFRRFRALALLTRETPPFLASGGPSVEADFLGRRAQYLHRPEPLDVTTFSIVASDSGGAVVYQWHEASDPVSRQVVNSLLSLRHQERPEAVVRFAFEYTENIAVSPVWWDSLATEIREALVYRMGSGASTLRTRRDQGLLDDGIRTHPFTIRRVVRRRLG